MDFQLVLQKLGFREKEAKVYLALLGEGELTATKMAEKANVDRTLVYQLVNSLIEKGFASYIVKNNVRYFLAADPDVLLKSLKEKEEQLASILPQLKLKQNLQKPNTKVEVYRGREGVNTILKTILRDNSPYFILGGAEEACKLFELENKVFVKRAEKLKLYGKILARKEDTFFVGKNEEYRFVDSNLISSTTMIMFGDKTAIFIWSEPYNVILIENDGIAKSNLSTFEYLWKTSELPSKADVKNRRNF